MFAPEEQQMEICLLKTNLEEIENDLVVQRSALPALDVESEQQYRETMNALRIARSINSEVERLKQDNVRLIAKRMQLKRQCEGASTALQVARENRNNLMNQLKLVEAEEQEQIINYEDVLREKAEKFRKARMFYNEEEINVEIEKIQTSNLELSEAVRMRESMVDSMYRELDSLNAQVPENIVEILGKTELTDKLKQLTDRCAELAELEDKRTNSVTFPQRRGIAKN